jgi:hypothetical protein
MAIGKFPKSRTPDAFDPESLRLNPPILSEPAQAAKRK